MKTTGYFDYKAALKRPEVKPEWIAETLANPVRRMVQSDGRIRFWRSIPEFGGRVLRVVTLADGETVHNAFFDRSFREDER